MKLYTKAKALLESLKTIPDYRKDTVSIGKSVIYGNICTVKRKY